MSFLPVFWFFLLLAVLLLFLILDGADLGIGILALFKRGSERSRILDSIGPGWYANETWLVIAGAIFFATFPSAYAVTLSSLYIPAMVMLFGIILRAASTSFRGRGRYEGFWDVSMAVGSLVALLGLGFLLGGLLEGIQVEAGRFTGGLWQWFGPISVLSGLGLGAGAAMLGAAYMVHEANHELPKGSSASLVVSACIALALLVPALVLVGIKANSSDPGWSGVARLSLISAFSAVALVSWIFLMVRAARIERGRTAYVLSIAMLLGLGGGAVTAVFPNVVPYGLSISDAASSQGSLTFALFGVAAILPIIVAYNIYVRRMLSRGRSDADHTLNA